MSAPKPGDRVMWNGAPWVVAGIVGDVAELRPHEARPHVPVANLSLLPQPVYVNSDTTERRNTDIARDRHGVVWVRVGEQWLNPAVDIRYRGEAEDPNGGGLTLLVRNGQVVQP